MKVYIAESEGNLFYMNDGILMACPLPAENGIIDLDEECCEVENNENPELLKKIREELNS